MHCKTSTPAHSARSTLALLPMHYFGSAQSEHSEPKSSGLQDLACEAGALLLHADTDPKRRLIAAYPVCSSMVSMRRSTSGAWMAEHLYES